MTTAERGTPGTQPAINRFFAEPLRDYVLQSLGRPVSLLQAGCLAPLRELGIGDLTEGGFEISVTAVDDDNPLARQVLRETQFAYDDVITGDLRTVPIPQRAYDVVYCAQLLERVEHVELVLDRLVSALKPGGLLLLRTGDRHSSAAPPAAVSGPQARLVQVPPRNPRPVPAGLREGGLRRGHLLLFAAARPRHRRPQQRADPPGPSGPAIIVGANHLRRYLPADRRTLHRRPR
jgi:SAM-dependent methyltransferase